MTIYNQDSIKTTYPEFVFLKRSTVVDMSGQKIGRLTFLYRYFKNTKDRKAQWVTICDCSKIVVVSGKDARTGHTLSCGCLREDTIRIQRENFRENIINKRYGKLVVLSEDGYRQLPDGRNIRMVNCQCDCGNMKSITASYLIDGSTKSCGCLSSVGELEIEQYCINNKIQYLRQVSFDDLKYKKSLRFDFGLYLENKLIILIEYNGRQHYDKNNGYYCSDIILTDKLKKEYCSKKLIPFITIKYNENTNDILNKLKEEYKL
jgi:hypothetical protein